MNEAENAFDAEMEQTYHESAKQGYKPTRFLLMVHEIGGVATAKKLLATAGTPEGLGRLWELGRLDISLEAIILKPEYVTLFTINERRIARERLVEMGL